MKASVNNLSVCVGEQVVCIKIEGRANFTSSVDFKTLVNSLWQQGHHHFVLDLTDCMLMDSTFLGVLAGLGLKFTNGEVKDPCQTTPIELLNPSARIADLLDAVTFHGASGRWPLAAYAIGYGWPSPKHDLDGAQVWDAVQAGRIIDVVRHCANDVLATTHVYLCTRSAQAPRIGASQR